MLELLARRVVKLQRAVEASNQEVNNVNCLIMHLPECEDWIGGSHEVFHSGRFCSGYLCSTASYVDL